MSITKEQWSEVEEQLKGLFGQCKFRLDGRELTVQRESYSESGRCLVVYIDGTIKFGWGWPDSKNFMPFTEVVWRKRSKAAWSPSRKAKLIKQFGGVKRTREYFSNLDKVAINYEAFFMKAGPLVRQYRRIKNLELISIGYQPKADT